MHALYDESRHVGKFQRDHQLQALRQTKGAQAAYRNILSNLRGAVRYDFITGRGTEVTHEGDVTFQCGNAFPFRSDSTSIIVRLGVLSRETAYEKSACRNDYVLGLLV